MVSVLVPRRLKSADIQIPTETIDLKLINATTRLTPRLLPPSEVYFEGGKSPSVEVVVRVRSRQAAVR